MKKTPAIIRKISQQIEQERAGRRRGRVGLSGEGHKKSPLSWVKFCCRGELNIAYNYL
ncbi:MAG: hypothetical protein RBR35_15675 [Salinivirgaceae bacterium]|nr:hypothetical protein [Salinivirgaceae bacterium]